MIVALCSLLFRAKIRKSSLMLIIKRVISEVVLLIALLLKTRMMDDAKKCGFIKTKAITYVYVFIRKNAINAPKLIIRTYNNKG